MKRFTLVLALAALAVLVSAPLSAFAAGTTPAPAVQKQQMNPAATTNAKSAGSSKASHASAKAHWSRMDLNTVSKEDLMKIPTMTDATADKIIAGRPYKKVSELESKQIVTKAEFAKLRSHVSVKPEPKAESKMESKTAK
jgi:DNA uptake protein ComE-like DNA-binding protein